MVLPLPFSQACENNKQPIFDILRTHLTNGDLVLEIAAGTGQHAAFFAGSLQSILPDLLWQSSDIKANVDSLELRITHAQLPNLPQPIPLDVNQEDWHCAHSNIVYSANSLHIMSADSVVNFFAGVGRLLTQGGILLVYGPFKYGGVYTSNSNANFDVWLKQRNPESGVRDFEWVDGLAIEAGLVLVEDNTMPANNQFLVWKKS